MRTEGESEMTTATATAVRADAHSEQHRSIAGHDMFNAEYVRRLANEDAATEQHFIDHFSPLLRLKVRAKLNSPASNDVIQDTLLRVLTVVHKKGGLKHPESLGGFVFSVCNNVLLEYYRQKGRSGQLDDNIQFEDHRIDLEGDLVSDERKQIMHAVLKALPKKDRDLLRKLFLEERDKDELCREYKVDRGYLRVMLHRALRRAQRITQERLEQNSRMPRKNSLFSKSRPLEQSWC
jgi:RNA polymerase sigma-70 factor (ECF subfamily)